MFSLKRQQNLLEKFKLTLLRNIIEKKNPGTEIEGLLVI